MGCVICLALMGSQLKDDELHQLQRDGPLFVF